MRIKLSKVCKEFNVDITTVITELKNNGINDYEVDPNIRITAEDYELLAKSFGRWTRIPALSWAEDRFGEDPVANRDEINSHGWNKMRNDTIIVMPTRYILIPKDQNCERLIYWTNEDFKTNCSDAIVDGKIIREKLNNPTGSIPVTPYISEPDQIIVEEELPYIFKTDTINPARVSVIGSIDLSSLNSSTRPKKKTKEERRQERQSKLITQSAQTHLVSTNESNESSNNTIRDIWQHFVDIQEKLIRQKCSPISIDPNSMVVEDDKLYVKVDDSQRDQILNSILRDKLGVEEYDLESGSILVDEARWDALSESELDEICAGLSECYVELDTTPAINVIVDYQNNLGRTDQLSINELRQLEAKLSKGTLIEGSIDDTAAFISKVTIKREEFLRYIFGDHYITYEKKKRKITQIIEVFEYHNEYITGETLRQYAGIGLQCNHYKLIFKINNDVAKEELRDCFDCYFPNTDTFEFKRVVHQDDSYSDHYIAEANANIKAFLDIATIYCSKDDVKIDVVFTYIHNKRQLLKSKFNEIAQYIKEHEGYSFNEETGTIGIDFKWREQSISELIEEVENAIPFIKINIHEDHRFKCKVESQLVAYEELKVSLEEKYEDISVTNDSINQQIIIRLPYGESNSYETLCTRINNDLLQMRAAGLNVTFVPKVTGKIRLNIRYNTESRLEDLKDRIMDMRRADFGFMLGDKEVTFGKLLRSNYPDLVFDIDVPDDKKDKIIEALESKALTTIEPILTGELEKISRLRNTFTMATTGRELTNPRLQNFIFDSSQATKTQDIDFLLRPEGPVYVDFCEHLLNDRINEPQKQAIIKAMYADDLAVIQGPPGTGKSTAIAELIWQLIRKGLQYGNQRERILLTSETNLAVDNAISRIVNNTTNLVKPIRFGDEEKLETEGLQFSIELMRRWVEEGDTCLNAENLNEECDTPIENSLILKNWLSNISRRAFYGMHDETNEIFVKWRKFLESPSKTLREIVYNRYTEGANVIGATCSSIGDKRAGTADFNGFTPFFHNYCDLFKQKKGRARIEFTTVIQDESSKATPAELVLPFVYGKKAIVIGDHRQLPPMLDREEFDETLDYAYKISRDDEREKINQLKHFVESHFDEMEISHFQKLYERIDGSLKGTFNLQYRMHPDINEVIEQFYREDGGLRCGLIYPKDIGVNDPDISSPTSRYHGIDIPGLMNPNTHVLFINTSSPEMLDGTSRVNYGEVESIDKLLTKLEVSDSFQQYLSHFSTEEDKQIGIISFYGKQIKQLRAIAHNHSTLPIRVSTVDRFQGMERNIVIVSMVRSHIIQSRQNQQSDKRRYPDWGYPKQTSLGFAQSPNRLNVALSRAKRLLIIVGNRELFSKLEIYQRLFMTIENNQNNRIINQADL